VLLKAVARFEVVSVEPPTGPLLWALVRLLPPERAAAPELRRLAVHKDPCCHVRK